MCERFFCTYAGRQLECGVNGVLSYQGESNDCVWLRQDMRFHNVVKVVKGTIQEGLQGRTLWYSTKYDRKILLSLQRDEDAGKLVKGNDELGYIILLRGMSPSRSRCK